jgi:16S rRNA U516 pseudouridylate synthase RsuA-like enzyme
MTRKKVTPQPKKEGMRINQFLSHAGIGSRRKVEEFILSGRIKVNGRKIDDLSLRIDPDGDVIEYQNRRVVIIKYHYIMLNKPKGVITSVNDEKNRPIVMDLLPERYRFAGVVPVGRLDKDTTGLLLMTNDGDMAHMLTHPKFGVDKEYVVELDKPLDEETQKKLEKGVFIQDQGRKKEANTGNVFTFFLYGKKTEKNGFRPPCSQRGEFRLLQTPERT